MIEEETIDFTVWGYNEIAQMEATARGFITGILSSVPFDERTGIKMRMLLSDGTVAIIVSNIAHDDTMRAFGYHVVNIEGTYSDEIFLCEIDTYSVEFDRMGLGQWRRPTQG